MNIIVFCTTATKENAKEIANALVKNKLAACVNIICGVNSVYEWKGKIAEDNEFLLIIKSKSEIFDKLETKIKELHTYEVPEIISFEIKQGSKPYLDWLNDTLLQD